MPAPTKTCSRCGATKPDTEKYFDLNLRHRDGLKDYCRVCSPAVTAERKRRKAERAREWARNNPEKIKESYQRSYEKHRRQRLAYMRRWRQENKERVAEYQREYAARKHQASNANEQSIRSQHES